MGRHQEEATATAPPPMAGSTDGSCPQPESRCQLKTEPISPLSRSTRCIMEVTGRDTAVLSPTACRWAPTGNTSVGRDA
eukprot:scaffold647_cov411-Prasinococcus_capsulatus_cf.AAC.15